MIKHHLKISKESIFLSVCIVLLTTFAFISIKSFLNDKIDREEFARRKILDRLNISIPDDCKLLYHCNSDSGFGPDDETYYFVFRFTEDPIIFLEKYEFQSDINGKFREKVIEIFNRSDEVYDWDVPTEYIPQFNYHYNYILKNSGWMLYRYNCKYLIVYIEGY